jgi:predicted phage terminase large subunit-like protein
LEQDKPITDTWSVVYEKAIRDDGSLLFPERLSLNFLAQAKRTMGSYLFANQYQNEIIPTDKQVFRKEWLRYWTQLPENLLTFGFLDPAISEEDGADYSALVIVSTDENLNWYVRHVFRQRINPTEQIAMLFRVQEKFKCVVIGIEDVAFQRSILHFAMEEARRRKVFLPIMGVKRGPDKTKEMRILSLVPRFEWGSVFLGNERHDLELELGQFPRGQHDDILDALSSIEEIVTYPSPRRKSSEPPAPNQPDYEKHYIKTLLRRTEGSGAEADYGD